MSRPVVGESLFDNVPDIVYFVKDTEGRYMTVNQTLVLRLGMKEKRDLLGKRASEVFPNSLGEAFSAQDKRIIRTGVGIRGQLEMHLYPDRKSGWCLTYKEPIYRDGGKIVGVAGISRDIQSPNDRREDMTPVSKVTNYIHENLGEPLRLPDLAEMAGLSVYQLDQRVRGLYNISAGQFITQSRIDRACHMLKRSKDSIVDIALECGYSDQSAFTRQFKQVTGMTPNAFRQSS